MRSVLQALSLVMLAMLPTWAIADHELQDRDLRVGQSLYTQHCAVCHGAALQGQPDWRVRNPDGTLPAPPHDETGHTWHHENGYLFTYTKYGGTAVMARMALQDMRSGMPAFGSVLPDEAIWAVLAFIQSTWPEDIKAIQAERNPLH
ncbi:MAG: c-type cytochrome [Pseudomonadota bacterium]